METFPAQLDSTYAVVASKGFYKITTEDIARLAQDSVAGAVQTLQAAGAFDVAAPISLYIENLCELWSRRVKFSQILETQPFPTAEQVATRSLLEYGKCEDSLLYEWLRWRKLLYDIDNRSAQETGYLFEPLLTSCLGGHAVASGKSMVKRIDASGAVTDRGRQIDCLVEERAEAYELKMRVTIAASGQGRFGEELSFPREVSAAGLTPILVVFDPTESSRLRQLREAYVGAGGQCHVGDAAWNLLRTRADSGMWTFIEKYVRPPLVLAEQYFEATPQEISLKVTKSRLIISDARRDTYVVTRQR